MVMPVKMTTVKRPEGGGQKSSGLLRVIVLLVAILGLAFMLFKNDPYTSANGGGAGAVVSSIRERKVQEDNKPVVTTNANNAGKTYVLSVKKLNDDKEGKVVIQMRPDWAPL